MMKAIAVTVSLAALISLPITSAHATVTTTENANVVAFFGTGNPPQGWQDVTDTGNNLQLDVRVKQTAVPGLTPNNGLGNYTPTSAANIEFSVNVNPGNVGGVTLATRSLTYWLQTDGGTPFNLTTVPNSYYGTNTTAESGGTKGTFATESPLFSIAQDSFSVGAFTATHTYDLFVTDANGKVLDSDIITMNAVPEASTYIAGFMLLLPFGFVALKKFRQQRSVA